MFFGVVLVGMPKETASPLIRAVEALNEVFVQMVWIVMKAMPIFVFALMAGQIVNAAGSDPEMFEQLLRYLLQYSIVVVIGLAFMVFLFYPSLGGPDGAETRLPPVHVRHARRPDHSLLHVKLRGHPAGHHGLCTEPHRRVGADHQLRAAHRRHRQHGRNIPLSGRCGRVARQFHMVDLSLTQQAVIVLTATLASIGAAAVPSAGLVLMIIVLESVGLNPAWIALIFPVDRILDMCRTVVNVTGDGAVSTLIANSEGELDVPEA